MDPRLAWWFDAAARLLAEEAETPAPEQPKPDKAVAEAE